MWDLCHLKQNLPKPKRGANGERLQLNEGDSHLDLKQHTTMMFLHLTRN